MISPLILKGTDIWSTGVPVVHRRGFTQEGKQRCADMLL